MKKLVVSMFFMVAASFFFVCGVSADSQVDFSLKPGETMVVYLDNEYSFEVPHDSAGDYGFFNWTVSERPISHSGLIQSSVVNYAGASMPNITVSAQRDNTNSGNVTFMFDSAVGAGATVRIYLSVAVTLQNQTDNPISGYMNLNLSAWNYNGNAIPNMGSANDKLNQILSALGEANTIKFAGDSPVWYLHNSYFGWASTGFNSAGYPNVGSSGTLLLQFTHDDDYINSYLAPGDYYFVISSPHSVSSISFDDSTNSGNYDLTDRYSVEKVNSGKFNANSSNFFSIYHIHVTEPLIGYIVRIVFSGTSSGVCSGALIPFSVDQSASAAINPDQSGLVNDVDTAGQQQQQQEDQLWTNINSYKGDLTFNLDDWSEAAGGLSYVSGIFMQIWNNSPTQIIILSLMLGIAMLSIGRGVHAAVRVSRHRDDD